MSMRISTQTDAMMKVFGEEKALEYFAKAGFDCLDFSLFTYFLPKDIIGCEYSGLLFEPREQVLEHFAAMKRQADKVGIAFGQIHTPFPAFVPGHPEQDGKMIEVTKLSLEIAEVLGAPYAVVHPITETRGSDDYFDVNMKFYGSLAETAKKTGVGICLENMFRGYRTGKLVESACSSPKDAIRLIDALNEKYGSVFSFCLDVGHAHINGYDPADYVRSLGGRLTALHIQDNDGLNDHHVIPFLHNIDWDPFCKALKETGYTGSFNLETDGFTYKFPPELCLAAINMIGEVCRYFVKKYEL